MTMRQGTGLFSWLWPFAIAALICLAIAGASRLGLLLWLHDRVDATGGVGFILLQGLRFDLATLGVLLAVPMTLTPLVNLAPRLQEPWLKFIRVFLVVVVGMFAFTEVTTPTFIREYDVRPNLLYLEYLKYPKEVFSMLTTGYKSSIAAAIIVLAAATWLAAGFMRRFAVHGPRQRPTTAVSLALLSLVVCVAAARSTLDHRPVNPSTVAFSNDALVNSLPLNSLYSALYAAYELRHEEQGFAYGRVAEGDAVAAERAAMGLPATSFRDPGLPTLHYEQATRQYARPLNLVIIVEESLGAEYVGSLGGLPLTPNLDALASEGIWFENLYATGTRSARGLEAIVAGFPPSASRSVLKLSGAQQHFFTLGEFLKQQGYDTSFIYGGEAQFDNMKGFFANNGFDTIIDKHDFVNPVYYGSWGASDEDVFRVAHEAFSAHDPDTPFFSLLFTTSNHTPFEFPDGRIELYSEPRASVYNAVKYADYAIGEFFRNARESSYWDDTVFLVVSDHNSRTHGADLVPIEQFHIPGLILGGSIESARWDRIASQIDLLPTLLSLVGVSGAHPAVGIDQTRPDIDSLPQRAFMQYGDMQAYREDDRVVILRKDDAPRVYRYEDREYQPLADDAAMIERAVALAAWPVIAYREHEYHLPDGQASGSR